MNVSASGEIMLQDYDIVEQAGGPLRAKSAGFQVTVIGGILHLDFRATNGLVAIVGIEIEK